MFLNTLRTARRVKTRLLLNSVLNDFGGKSTTTNLLMEEPRNWMSSEGRPQKAVNKQPPQLRRDKQQQAGKRKVSAYIPGTVTLQILGAGANGAPCSVYLFTDQARYLFNCGEGTQRLAHEHKTKLSRLEQIFVTRNTWPVMGGFPGLALTVQDAGVRQLSLHGPPHLDNILWSMKRFVVLKNLQVKTRDCTQEHDFEDGTMTVRCIPLHHPANGQAVIAYRCKLKPRPGALNLEKCVEHGVPPGPLLGLLKNGSDVTLENGKVVLSKDVSEPGETAVSFLFLDIPHEDYLAALQQEANTLLQTQGEDGEVALVVHFSPPHILENNCYKSLMQKFSDDVQHIYLNSPQNSFSGYIATHRIQYQLNQLNSRIFPLLKENPSNGLGLISEFKKTKLNGDSEQLATEELVSNSNDSDGASLPAINSMTNFHLRPRKGLDHSQEAKLNPTEYIGETQVLEGFTDLLQKLKDDIAALKPIATHLEYPKITFLGTGSCIPNKTRNVSAILVEPKEDSFVLLDCGEGTYGQIVRFFGKTKADHVMRQLKFIYVSHLHADHHIGLIGLINERQKVIKGSTAESPQLLLFAPVQIESWLKFYDERIERISDSYKLIGNAAMLEAPLDLSAERSDVGVSSIATCLVRHCPHSYGISLTVPPPRDGDKPVKITYSGDSMPCRDLVDLGRDSTILIHEATMEDDLFEEAKVKMHSTISQAIDQGRAMQAEHIILTHFSQRYAKLPRFGADTQAETLNNVSIAFDNMQVSLGDLPTFHLLYPALRALFAEHADELDQKALKRELKLERKRKLTSE